MTVPDRSDARAEQMALFQTRSLPDGTTRGSYFPPGAPPEARMAASAHRQVTPTDFSDNPELTPAEFGKLGFTHQDPDAEPRTPNSGERLVMEMKGGPDLSLPTDEFNTVAKLHQRATNPKSFAPPKNSFVYGHETTDPNPDNPTGFRGGYEEHRLKDGGRAHMASIKHSAESQPFWERFSEDTDFGDSNIRSEPYDFSELTQRNTHYPFSAQDGFKDSPLPPDLDDNANTSWWTPDHEQVVGMVHFPSANLEKEQGRSITGAGTGSAFRGRGYGGRAAMEFAVQMNRQGMVAHGNSFTDDGQKAFGDKGAPSEADISERVRAATKRPDGGWETTEDLEAGTAKVAGEMLNEQKEMLKPALPYLTSSSEPDDSFVYQPRLQNPKQRGMKLTHENAVNWGAYHQPDKEPSGQ